MRKIAVLDQHTIDKIAAGEVVERPSSVVKELVENSIDAGATAVTVEIADGGKKLIRITDNGSGMEADQVPTAFLSHATSKIEKVEDLENIASLGFRGEALSSIAAVSQVELITKTPSAISGIRYVIEGGREQKLEEMGAPEGTTFLVRNLFFNTPARSKFLKADATEANYIGSLMEQLALSHPEISFKYIQNKQVKLYTSGNYSVKDVIYNIYGRDITKALLEVSYKNDFMEITGFAGKPEISRGNRTFENYYVNGRYVKNNLITKAIEDGYKGFLMQHKFPFVSLSIQMTGNDLDVNVHPRKMEVRFARGPEVYDGIYEAVRRALTKKEMIQSVPVGKEEPEKKPKNLIRADSAPEPFEVKRREQLYGKTGNAPGNGGTGTVSSRTVPTSPRKPDYRAVFDKQVSEKTVLEKPISEKSAIEKQLSEPRVSGNSIWDKQSDMLNEPSGNTSAPFTKEEEHLFDGTLTEHRKTDRPEKKITQEAIENKDKDVRIPDVEAVLPEESSKVKPVHSEEPAKTEPVHLKAPSKAEPVQQEPEPKQLELFQEKFLAPESRSRHKLIGQLFDTYWLVEFENNFYIIDQHAAHEKVYYERLVRQMEEQTIDSQYVSPPLIVTLNLEEEARLKANEDYFRRFGFEIEPFGGREFCISAVPADLFGNTEEELFLDMLDHLAGEGDKDALSLFTARLATMACKAAVKGNHQMSPLEADKLIDELLTLENPYHCPHGRPTIISMTKSEIEKKFKRIL